MARLDLDPAHTHIGFTAKHMMVSTVRGSFPEFSGHVEVDKTDPTAAVVEVTAKTGSVTSGAEDRDKHLRSNDFFDSENYPDMTFKSTRVEKIDDGHFKVVGDLTIRTITKALTLDVEVGQPFEDGWGNERVGVSATGRVNRKDWGLEWNVILEAGRLLVSEEAKLEIDTELMRKLVTAEVAA